MNNDENDYQILLLLWIWLFRLTLNLMSISRTRLLLSIAKYYLNLSNNFTFSFVLNKLKYLEVIG